MGREWVRESRDIRHFRLACRGGSTSTHPIMRHLLVALALLIPCHGQELTIDEIKEALVAGVEAFEPVTFPVDGKPVKLDIKLGEKPVKIRDDRFDGFRFRCPDLPEGTDFVWYFNAPKNWGNWYILPVEGKPGQAFKGWLDGDKLYDSFDKSGEKDRLRILQTLDGAYFKPGAEYLMWFRKTGDGPGDDVRGIAAFVKKSGDSWDHDDIEKALGLKEAPLEDQVASLSSKGGLILLDQEFFDRGYAAGRIDSAFSSIRSTKRMKGGFFVTMQTAVPPCKTQPSLAAIVKKYGEPDFVRDGAEEQKKSKHAGGEGGDEDEKGTTRYFYDYFALEVETGAKDPKVLRVVTFGCDFSAVRAPAAGTTFASIDIENLTVFHKDGKEVGRAYFFREGSEEPIFITEPPAGEYRSGSELLVAKGKGEWIWENRFPDGKMARRFPMKGNRLNGKAEGYYENGQPQFTAEYRKGDLEGEVVEFDKAGKETSKRIFKDGEPVGDGKK